MNSALSLRERAVLEAFARVVVPHAFRDVSSGTDFLAAIDRRLQALPPHIHRDLRRALRVLDHPVARLVLGRVVRRWDDLPLPARERAFTRLGESPFPAGRVLHQAVRRLLLSTWYATPAGLSDARVRPPMHQRPPEFEWEGPMPGPDGGVVATGDRTLPPPLPPPAVRGSITRGSDLHGSFRFKTDVVVIGSGAGGSIVAARLAAAGREVLILEGGSWLEPSERNEDEAVLFPRLMADGGSRSSDDLALSVVQGATVGGSTSVNWMIMLRTPDHVLDEWQRRFGLVDLSSASLAPEFERIEAELSVGVVPDEAHSPANRLLLEGARRLGWQASAARVNARGCQRSGHCTIGCRYDARRGAAQVYLPMAFAHGARLLADTRVDRVVLRGRDTGRGTPLKEIHATVRDPDSGQVVGSVVAEAPVVIVAAGAIETPALLQRSGMGGGAVGRWLRVHPTTGIMGVYPRVTYPLTGMPLTAMVGEFAQRGPNGYGFWIECPALGPALAAASMPEFGEAHRRHMQALDRTAPFIALTRDGADLDRSNGSVAIDRDGNPRIRYRLGARDASNVRASIAAAAHLHLEAGAEYALTLHTKPIRVQRTADLAALARAPVGPNQVGLFTAHVNGTCRMGGNRREAAVSPEGERYGSPGVYIADGSLLPTAPGVNPQATIYAIASRVAASIIAR